MVYRILAKKWYTKKWYTKSQVSAPYTYTWKYPFTSRVHVVYPCVWKERAAGTGELPRFRRCEIPEM